MRLFIKFIPIYLLYITDFALCNSGLCFRENREDTFCCDFFEERNGTCVECEKGFESHQGQHCEPCKPNKYGEFCVEICECKAFQICNHVKGCLEVPVTQNLTINKGVPVNITLTEDSNMDGNNGIFKKWIMPNLTGISGFVLSMVFCSTCAIYFIKKSRKNRNSMQTEDVPNGTTNEDIHESTYEEIDEAAVQEEVLREIDIQSTYTDDSSDRSSGTDNSGNANSVDDYLNPYQPIVKESEPRNYTGLKNELTVFQQSSVAKEGVGLIEIHNYVNENKEINEDKAVLTDCNISRLGNKTKGNSEKYENMRIV